MQECLSATYGAGLKGSLGVYFVRAILLDINKSIFLEFVSKLFSDLVIAFGTFLRKLLRFYHEARSVDQMIVEVVRSALPVSENY